MHFDIETRGQYIDFNTFESNEPLGSKIFRHKYDTYLHKDFETIDMAYLNRCSIVSTYGAICCISMGFKIKENDINIVSMYGEDEEDILKKFNKNFLGIFYD